MIDQPGIYDIPAEEYHSDPVTGGSLSSTGARKLLPPSCPALFRHWADEGQEYKAVFDLGHAAHAEVLGVGAPLAVVDADDWRTKAAKQQRDTAYAAGATPLLSNDYEQVQAMATALRQHPVAGSLFTPGTGCAEKTLIWRDREFGVWRRAMLDWFTVRGGRFIVVDYKSCRSAEPGYLSKTLYDFGYYQQDPYYRDGAEAVGLAEADEAAFVFVFQEKTPPYLITIVQADPEAVEWGRRRNRKALDTYRMCTETGQWPGYGDAVLSLSLPRYATYQLDAAHARGDYDPISLPLEDIAS
jgi:hypothetical protein